MNDKQTSNPPVLWSVSHSDSSAGTGIQADLHTFHDFDTYGCTVITALAAENSFAQGYVLATEHKSVVAQINALDSDLPAKVIKVGMLPNREVAETIVKYLLDFDGFVIYDPELQRSETLMKEAGELIKSQLLPRANLLVVNVQEAETLTDMNITSEQDIVSTCQTLLGMGAKSVLITGAQFDHLPGKRLDYWSDASDQLWLTINALDTANNRGGGSTLSAAIAAATARGMNMQQSLKTAKAYVTQGIRSANQLGSGPGSVAHLGMPEGERDLPEVSPSLITV